LYDIRKGLYRFCEKWFLRASMHMRDVETGAYVMRLYVGGLPYQTTEQDLIDLFSQGGEVASAVVITDRDTGRSKGFGFVEMNDDQEARSAIDRLNGTTLGERTITVNEARERQSGGRGGFGGGRDRDRRSGGGGGGNYNRGGRY
jgi:cold-inducible RNA-binding protein